MFVIYCVDGHSQKGRLDLTTELGAQVDRPCQTVSGSSADRCTLQIQMTYAIAGLGPPGAGLAGTWLTVPLFFLFFLLFFFLLLLFCRHHPANVGDPLIRYSWPAWGRGETSLQQKLCRCMRARLWHGSIVSLAARLDTYVHVSGGRGGQSQGNDVQKKPDGQNRSSSSVSSGRNPWYSFCFLGLVSVPTNHTAHTHTHPILFRLPQDSASSGPGTDNGQDRITSNKSFCFCV